MSNLVKMLRRAYAIEIGAYNAYEGHWRSIKPIDREERGKIKWIQVDELLHREAVVKMLAKLGSKPDPILNGIFWLIGKSISISCYVMPYSMAMWGARIMERLGAICYNKVAIEALNEGEREMAVELIEMQRTEQEHEKFFMSVLKPKCICRYLRYLNGNTAREVNPFCRAEHNGR